jgi:hypothetical protein
MATPIEAEAEKVFVHSSTLAGLRDFRYESGLHFGL